MVIAPMYYPPNCPAAVKDERQRMSTRADSAVGLTIGVNQYGVFQRGSGAQQKSGEHLWPVTRHDDDLRAGGCNLRSVPLKTVELTHAVRAPRAVQKIQESYLRAQMRFNRSRGICRCQHPQFGQKLAEAHQVRHPGSHAMLAEWFPVRVLHDGLPSGRANGRCRRRPR